MWDEALIISIRPDAEQRANRAQCILSAAEKAQGCHILIVHADADGPTSEKALAERFYPGLLLAQRTDKDVCQNILPIIPIQEIESWLLADKESLFKVLRVNPKKRPPDVPPAQRIESAARPKEHLEHIIRFANHTNG